MFGDKEACNIFKSIRFANITLQQGDTRDLLCFMKLRILLDNI